MRSSIALLALPLLLAGCSGADITIEGLPGAAATSTTVPTELVWIVLRGPVANIEFSENDRTNWSCAIRIGESGGVKEGDPVAIADDSGMVISREGKTIGGTTLMRNGKPFPLTIQDTPNNFRELWISDDGMYECRFQTAHYSGLPPSDFFTIVLGDPATGPFQFTPEEAVASKRANQGAVVLTFNVEDAGQ